MMKRMVLSSFIVFIIGVFTFIVRIHTYSAANHKESSNDAVFLSGFVSFLSLVIVIGGSIIITLLYVSWRKYKGHRTNDKSKKHKFNR